MSDVSELHRAIKDLRASNKGLIKTDKHREKIWKERVNGLQETINKAKVDQNAEQSCDAAVDNSYTGQIAQWRNRAETAEQKLEDIAGLPDKWNIDEDSGSKRDGWDCAAQLKAILEKK